MFQVLRSRSCIDRTVYSSWTVVWHCCTGWPK